MIAFMADLHLTRFVWKSRRDIEGDSFRALDAAKDVLFQAWKQTDEPLAIFLGGDIFDERKLEGSVLKAFTDFVDFWYEQEVPVYFVQGNHDTDAVQAIAEIQGAIHIDKKIVEVDGLKIYGLDWRPRKFLHEELAAAPACDYVMLHAMFDHLVDFEAATDISLDDIPSQIQNVLVGDVHIRDITPFNNGVCVSPGPLHACNIEQVGPHGVHVLARGQKEWQFHPYSTRDIRRFRCMDEGSLEQARVIIGNLEQRPENMETIVEVRYVAEYADEVQAWPDRNPHLKFFLKPSASGKMVSMRDLEEAQKTFSTLTLENSLGTVVDEKKEPALHALLQELLAGDTQNVADKYMEGIECVQ